jgi:hypothetical protein
VIEDARAQQRFVDQREKSDARTDARAHDADAFVTLFVQPTDRGARVEHGLAHGLERAPDVGRDEMICAFEFGRATRAVIRERQAQGGDAEAREDVAELDVAVRLRVPFGQHDDGAARVVLFAGDG